ncbi:MAG: chemotaxis protein CheW [Myxococcota bacterium]
MANVSERVLLCRAGGMLCALPLAHVVETMRALPIETIGAAPACVSGLALVRGEPTLVIDLARLLGARESSPRRFVSLRTGARTVALAVDDVLGARALSREALRELPPLLREAELDSLAAIGRHDAELLAVLESGQIVSESEAPPDAPARTP